MARGYEVGCIYQHLVWLPSVDFLTYQVNEITGLAKVETGVRPERTEHTVSSYVTRCPMT